MLTELEKYRYSLLRCIGTYSDLDNFKLVVLEVVLIACTHKKKKKPKVRCPQLDKLTTTLLLRVGTSHNPPVLLPALSTRGSLGDSEWPLNKLHYQSSLCDAPCFPFSTARFFLPVCVWSALFMWHTKSQDGVLGRNHANRAGLAATSGSEINL